MKKITPWLILVMVALLAIVAAGPVLGEEEPEDEEEVTISREGKGHRTKVLKEAPDPDHGRPARRGGFIVNFNPGLSSAERERVHQETGVTALKRARLRDSDVVSVKALDWKKAMKAYRDRPEVQSVEPDLIVRTTLTPNDPSFGQQWGMTKINAPQAWNTTIGSTAVRIAVLDCGVYAPETSSFLAPDGLPGHPDLRSGKVVNWINFTTAPDSDDFCNHGTHVAGIAAANTNNGIGVAGVGFNSKIVNVKVLGDDGSGSFSGIISGILWTAGCPADPALPCGTRRAEVINMSLGAATTCSSSLQQAINRAWAQGLVIVAAAGNSNSNGAFSPASCNNIVAVSASTTTDTKASFSNFGSWVGVAAPGVSILSTDYVGNYDDTFSGTSMSSPHVAGLAALVWTTPHNTGNAGIVNRILSTANHSALAGSVNGRIDAAAAVGASPPGNTPPTAANKTANTNAGTAVAVTLSATDPAQCQLSFAIVGGPSNGILNTITNNSCTSGTPNADTAAVTYTPNANFNGSDSFTYRANDGTANSNTATVSITVAPAAACSAAVTSDSDTNNSGGGTVTVNVALGSSVTKWRVQRQEPDATWSTQATLAPSNNTWSGADSSGDPRWRIGRRCSGVWSYGAPFDPS